MQAVLFKSLLTVYSLSVILALSQGIEEYILAKDLTSVLMQIAKKPSPGEQP